ncbi:MAG: amidohydrolase family protein, partial [Egibacteraceae bacterium]
MAELAEIPFVDHHCHSLRGTWTTAGGDPPGWRRCFTEATDPVTLARHVPWLVGYRRFLSAMATRLGLELGEDLEHRVLARRDELAAADPAGYLSGLLDDAGVTALLVDTGFGGPDTLGLADLAVIGGRPAREVVRVESVAQELLAGGGPAASGLDRFAEAFEDRLVHALDGGAVALKSVAAYRTGLALPRPRPADARRAFTGLNRARQALRLDDQTLVAFLLWRTAELAAQRCVPLQIHTGFGDADLDLRLADPALLRPLLRDPRTQGCPVVLLHCYPFVAQAAYLAGVYPQVWMDLSLAIPLAQPLAARLVGEALGLCPATKLLAATDGHSYPEMHWWAAHTWRHALAQNPDAAEA